MKAPAPTKGVKPVFTGVTGILMDAAPSDVQFGERKSKGSPYDALLVQLQGAGHGKFLKFEDLRARPSIIARAKKLNIKVLFGEQGQTLWVTLAKVELATNGTTEAEPAKPSMSEIVLAAVKAGRSTAGEIVTWARSNGAPGIGITQVDGLLSNLARAQKVKMKATKGIGADQPERWVVA